MPTYPDWSRPSRHNPMAAFEKMLLADNVPVLGSEDGENQDIIGEKTKGIWGSLFSRAPVGLLSEVYPTVDSTTKTFEMGRTSALCFGDLYTIRDVDADFSDLFSLSLDLSPYMTDGLLKDPLFVGLEVFKKVVTKDDIIRPYGNQRSGLVVDNYLVNDKINDETSRRVQLCFRLTGITRDKTTRAMFAQGNNPSLTTVQYRSPPEGDYKMDNFVVAESPDLHTVDNKCYFLVIGIVRSISATEMWLQKENYLIVPDASKYDYHLFDLFASEWAGDANSGYVYRITDALDFECEPMIRPYYPDVSGPSVINAFRAIKEAYGCIDRVVVEHPDSEGGVLLPHDMFDLVFMCFDEKPTTDLQVIVKCKRFDYQERSNAL